METCKYCNEGSFGHYILAESPWFRIELFNNGGDDVYISAHGDNYCLYEPKFCPECGRRLSRQFWRREETDNWI